MREKASSVLEFDSSSSIPVYKTRITRVQIFDLDKNLKISGFYNTNRYTNDKNRAILLSLSSEEQVVA